MSKHKTIKLLSLLSTSAILVGGSASLILVSQCGNEKPSAPKAPFIHFSNAVHNISHTVGDYFETDPIQVVDQDNRPVSGCTFTLNYPADSSPISNAELQFDSETGIISGTPTIIYICSNLTITATYGDLSRKSNPFTINIAPDDRSTQFRFTNAPTQIDFHYDSPFTPTSPLEIVNGYDQVVDGWTFALNPEEDTIRPDWLNFNAETGVISGTSDSHDYSGKYKITAYKANISFSTSVFFIRNEGLAPLIRIKTQPTDILLSPGTVYTSPTLQVVDQHDQPVFGCTFTLNIPDAGSPISNAGLNFDEETGVISGTATSAPYSYAGFTITATYNGLTDVTESFSIYNEQPYILWVTQPSSFTFSYRTPVTSNPIVINDNNGRDVTDQCTFTLNGTEPLPEGLNFDETTGIISGTLIKVIPKMWTFNYTITATYADLSSGPCNSFSITNVTDDYTSIGFIPDVPYFIGQQINPTPELHIYDRDGSDVTNSGDFAVFEILRSDGQSFSMPPSSITLSPDNGVMSGTVISAVTPDNIWKYTGMKMEIMNRDTLEYSYSNPFSFYDLSSSFHFDGDLPAKISLETHMDAPMVLTLPNILNQDDITMDNQFFSISIKDSNGNDLDWINIDTEEHTITIPSSILAPIKLNGCTLCAKYGDTNDALSAVSNTFDIDITDTPKIKYLPDGSNWIGHNHVNGEALHAVMRHREYMLADDDGEIYSANNLVIPDEIWNEEQRMFYPLTKIEYNGLAGGKFTITGTLTLGANIETLETRSMSLYTISSLTLTTRIKNVGAMAFQGMGCEVQSDFHLYFDGFSSQPTNWDANQGDNQIEHGYVWGAFGGLGWDHPECFDRENYHFYIGRKNGGKWPGHYPNGTWSDLWRLGLASGDNPMTPWFYHS